MPRFKRKTTFVEAEQLTREKIEAHLFDGQPLPRGVHVRRADFHRERRTISNVVCTVTTIQGQDVQITCGEWIMPEPDGEHFYPCADDVFRSTYEPADETAEVVQ